MAKEVVLFASEERHSLKSVAAFLRDLADRLDTNEVILRKGAEELVVPIPENVVLEIKVEEEEKKQRTQRSLEIEIEWYEGEDQGSLSLGQPDTSLTQKREPPARRGHVGHAGGFTC